MFVAGICYDQRRGWRSPLGLLARSFFLLLQVPGGVVNANSNVQPLSIRPASAWRLVPSSRAHSCRLIDLPATVYTQCGTPLAPQYELFGECGRDVFLRHRALPSGRGPISTKNTSNRCHRRQTPCLDFAVLHELVVCGCASLSVRNAGEVRAFQPTFPATNRDPRAKVARQIVTDTATLASARPTDRTKRPVLLVATEADNRQLTKLLVEQIEPYR